MKRHYCSFGTAPKISRIFRFGLLERLTKSGRRLLGLCAAGHLLALANGADLTVTSTADAGAGSLRQAISDVVAGGTIDFDAGVFNAASGGIALASELVVSKPLTVDASGVRGGVTLTGGQATRLVRVAAAGNVRLRGFTLTQGNSAGSTAGGFGGAVFNQGTTVLEDCTLTANAAVNYGGAVANAGSLELVRCTVSGNHADSLGGGLYNADPGTLTLTNSTVTANSATLYGGAIYHTSPVTLNHATLVGNHAGNKGGGIYNDFNSVLNLRSSIVAANTAPNDNNLFGPFEIAVSSITSGDPKLAPLGDYGGLTQTMPPLPDSPAIDQGLPEGLATDQRGFPRTMAAATDIGAVEAEVGSYTPGGLTLHTRVPAADADGFFEISTDPDFLPVVGTFAGTGEAGVLDGYRAAAKFSYPAAVVLDVAGNTFVADPANHRIRMIDAAGNASTIAGSGPLSGLANGPGPNAAFAFPSAVAVGPDGNIYVADTFNHRICKLVRPTVPGGVWMVETLAGPGSPGNPGFLNQSGSAARFAYPYGLTVDAAGNVFVADTENHRIRKITAAGAVSTFAGSGTASHLDSATPTAAAFDSPQGVIAEGTSLFVADTGNHCIREITTSNALATGVTTFAGSTSRLAGDDDGSGTAAKFASPTGLASDGAGVLYVADSENHRIRRITGVKDVTTVAGKGTAGFTNGRSDLAEFHAPTGLMVAADGNLIVADGQNQVLRRVIIKNTKMDSTVVSGDVAGAGQQQVSAMLDAVALGLDPGATYFIRWISSTTGTTQTMGQRFTLYDLPSVVTKPETQLVPTQARLNATVNPNASPTEVVLQYSTDPDMLPPFGVSTLPGSAATGLVGASGIAGDGSGGAFVADHTNQRILHITATGAVTTLAGSGTAGLVNGSGLAASFEDPAGLARAGNGDLYLADSGNHCIRKISPLGGVTTFAGTGVAGFGDGAAGAALFLYPSGVAVDTAGNVFVADTGNHRIRKISATTGEVTTVAGTGVSGITADGSANLAQFASPQGIAVNADGTRIWVADTGNQRVRLVFSDNVFTLAGNGSTGFADGAGADAQFSSPRGIAVDAADNAYISDSGNHRIRRVRLDGTTLTLAGSGVAGTVNSPLSGSGLFPATAAQFDAPAAIAVDAAGRLFVTQDGLVREISRALEVPALVIAPRASGTGERLLSADIPQPLLPNATYYFRAVGTNYRGTVTGETLSFLTPQAAITVAQDSIAISHQQSSAINYGNTPTGQPVSRTFTIRNPGSFALHLSAVNAPAGYVLSGGPWVIQPLDSLDLDITLSAASAGTFSGDVSLLSDAPGQTTFSFPLTGVVLDPPGVTTLAATATSGGSATLNGLVNPRGSSTNAWFEWSLDAEFDGLTVTTLAASLDQPSGLATDSAGNIYIADTLHHRIRKIDANGTETVFAGTGIAGFANGPVGSAQFNEPIGIVVGSNGTVFVADSKNHRIRAISTLGTVTTFAGLGDPAFTDGVAAAARFNLPSGLALSANGDLLVADRGNHRIRSVGPNGTVGTRVGDGTAGSADGAAAFARFDNPVGIAVDAAGTAYVTEASGHAIRKVAPDGFTSLFAGNATTSGLINAAGPAARFSSPTGLTVRADGTLVVADTGNHLIRAISPLGIVTPFVGSGAQGGDDGRGEVANFDQPISLATTPDGGVIVGEIAQPTLRRIDPTQVLVQVATGLTGTTELPIETTLSGLDPGAIIYFRVIATNGGGTTVGSIVSFGDPFAVWQNAEFGANAGDPLIAGPLANPAQDGINNLLKFAFGLDPHVATAAGLPAMDTVGGKLALTYHRNLAATNLIYTPEWSTNLSTWSPLGVTEDILADDGITRQIRASIPASPGGARFLRINVTLQQP
jgi:sugar lactone lactonase YvrE